MDVKLEIFLAVARNGSFSRAADELNMSQPAVSQQIKSLENEFGVKLLERNTKMVTLTRAGEVIHHFGQQIIQTYDVMNRLISELREETAGPLVIGASNTFGEYVLPELLAEFCRMHPQVHPTVHVSNTAEISELLSENKVDLAIVEGEVRLPGVTSRELMEDRIVIAVSPDYPLLQHGMPVREMLSAATWVLREKGSRIRAAADRMLLAAGIVPEFVMEFSSTQAIKGAVTSGLGMSVLSNLSIKEELEQGQMSVIQLTEANHVNRRKFYLLQHHAGFEPKVVEQFKQHLIGRTGVCEAEITG